MAGFTRKESSFGNFEFTETRQGKTAFGVYTNPKGIKRDLGKRRC